MGGLGAGVLLSAVGITLACQRDRGPETRAELVGRRDLVSVVTASGNIQPKRKVDISADISGRVTDLGVEEGQWVDEGAVILRIDQPRSAPPGVSFRETRTTSPPFARRR